MKHSKTKKVLPPPAGMDGEYHNICRSCGAEVRTMYSQCIECGSNKLANSGGYYWANGKVHDVNGD